MHEQVSVIACWCSLNKCSVESLVFSCISGFTTDYNVELNPQKNTDNYWLALHFSDITVASALQLLYRQCHLVRNNQTALVYIKYSIIYLFDCFFLNQQCSWHSFSPFACAGICSMSTPRGSTLSTGWHRQEILPSKSSLWVERILARLCVWVLLFITCHSFLH